MKSIMRLISALWLVSALGVCGAWAQPYTPNTEGVTMGHWHLNSRDVERTKKMFLAMGGVDGGAGPLQRVSFPGVLVILNLPAGAEPATAGTEGSVVNHVGFDVPNVQEAVAKWKAAGVPVLPGGNNRLDQAWVVTPDGLRIEILEDKNQTVPVKSGHVHFFQPAAVIPESQAWYVRMFGATPGIRNNLPVDDLPGTQLRFNKVEALGAPTKGRVLDHIGFDVIDLKAAIGKLEAKGVKLDRPYSMNPQGVGIAFITDPFGTYIELNQRPNAAYLN
jgi:catechol 2,3-dioxygenase-like lactoylglutathione lyase family enzyme